MQFESFTDRNAASAAAASRIATALRADLQRRPSCMLAVSGGSTPIKTFETLSSTKLPWHRIKVCLTDERLVPNDHKDSNERMLRQSLLQHEAADARLLPMSCVGDQPFAIVLLGMGEDGHFASIFPDADNLDEALSPDTIQPVVQIRTAASPHRRDSLTLNRLLNSEEILLLVFGAEKRKVIEDAEGLPVAHLLENHHTPVTVFWAP